MAITREHQGKNSRWTEAEDELLIELWRNQKCLFDPSVENYHNTNRKLDKWKYIAGQLGKHVDDVRRRATSLRTMYGKLLHSSTPGGSEAKPYTSRQKWLWWNLEFLQGFLTRRCHAPTATPNLQGMRLSSGDQQLRRARDRPTEKPLEARDIKMEPLSTAAQDSLSTSKPTQVKTESEQWHDLPQGLTDQKPFDRRDGENAGESEPIENFHSTEGAAGATFISVVIKSEADELNIKCEQHTDTTEANVMGRKTTREGDVHGVDECAEDSSDNAVHTGTNTGFQDTEMHSADFSDRHAVKEMQSDEQHNASFSSRKPFETHEKVANLHTCSDCGNHTRPKTHPACTDCGKNFSQPDHLNADQQIHTGQKPTASHACDHNFRQLGSFKYHQNIHTGEELYSCAECGKSFKRFEFLKWHLRIHTDEKPYSCTECGKSFPQTGDAKLHDIHTDRKAVSCCECGFQCLDIACSTLQSALQGDGKEISDCMSVFQSHECLCSKGELRNTATISTKSEFQGKNTRWTETQDEKLIELWQKQKCLFDPTVESYHNKKWKNDKWRKIAGRLGRNVAEVRKRATSLRTMYGKLLHSDGPMACEAKPHTGRQRWLMRKLDFLQGFVRRRYHAQTTAPKLQSVVLSSENRRPRQVRDRLSEDPFGSCHLHIGSLNSTQEDPLSPLKPRQIKTESEECGGLSEQFTDEQPFGRKQGDTTAENELNQSISNAESSPGTPLISIQIKNETDDVDDFRTEQHTGTTEKSESSETEPLMRDDNVHEANEDSTESTANVTQTKVKVDYTEMDTEGLSDHHSMEGGQVDQQHNASSSPEKFQETLEKEENLHLCTDCGSNFDGESFIKIHQTIHTRLKPLSSTESGKTFRHLGSFKNHQKSHTGGETYSCIECGKTFARFDILKQHQRVHTGEKPFPCSECGKSFRYINNLKNHKRIHTGEKPYSCPECGKSFRQTGDLKKHCQIHTGEKPFSCTECGKRFRCLDILRGHWRIHTGEKPYSCTECEMSFRYSGALKYHRQIHTGERPYLCTACGMSFRQLGILKRHQQIHTG